MGQKKLKVAMQYSTCRCFLALFYTPFTSMIWVTLWLWLTAPLAMAETIQATPGTLQTSLQSLAPGTTLELEAGTYPPIVLQQLSGTATAPIIIRSADTSQPATLTGFVARESAHIHLQALNFDYVFAEGDPRHTRPFILQNSHSISVQNSIFDGDLAFGEGAPHDGFPTSFGLALYDTHAISLISNTFRTHMRAIVINNSRHITIRGNDISQVRSDGVNFTQVQDILFEGNHIHDFLRSPASGDHSDMLQIWTRGTTEPSKRITIRGNVFNAGYGRNTQTIFMGNEQVSQGHAGRRMFYEDIIIDDNVIINAHLHGITVGATDGLRIQNNTVVRNFHAAGENPQRDVWTPRINVSENSLNVAIQRNVTSAIAGHTGQASWTVSDNVFVQDNSRLQPGFYGLYFAPASTNDPRHVSSFRALTGGPLDGTGIGASRLGRN